MLLSDALNNQAYSAATDTLRQNSKDNSDVLLSDALKWNTGKAKNARSAAFKNALTQMLLQQVDQENIRRQQGIDNTQKDYANTTDRIKSNADMLKAKENRFEGDNLPQGFVVDGKEQGIATYGGHKYYRQTYNDEKGNEKVIWQKEEEDNSAKWQAKMNEAKDAYNRGKTEKYTAIMSEFNKHRKTVVEQLRPFLGHDFGLEELATGQKINITNEQMLEIQQSNSEKIKESYELLKSLDDILFRTGIAAIQNTAGIGSAKNAFTYNNKGVTNKTKDGFISPAKRQQYFSGENTASKK